MAILVRCGACGGEFRAKESHRGHAVPCPACGQTITIEGRPVTDYDVFITYAHEDKKVADAICAGLESYTPRPLRCWIAPRDVVAGQEWGAAIIEAIGQSRVMVLVYSSHSNQSKQVIREVERAVSKNVIIVPLRIEDVPPTSSMEYFISANHWMDAVTPPLAAHVKQLAATIQTLLGRAPEPAPAAAPQAQASSRRPFARWVALGVALITGAILYLRPSFSPGHSTVPRKAPDRVAATQGAVPTAQALAATSAPAPQTAGFEADAALWLPLFSEGRVNGWIRRDPEGNTTTSMVRQSDGAVLVSGVLEYPLTARDVVIRAAVRKLSGANAVLQLRTSQQAGRAHGYAAWYNGRGVFGIGKRTDGQWHDLSSNRRGTSPQERAVDYIQMEFSAIGDELLLKADGRVVARATDTDHFSGMVGLSVPSGQSLFRNLEARVLDVPPAPNTLSAIEQRAGWELLFNGRDLRGWKGYYDAAIPEGWQVTDGTIVRKPGGKMRDGLVAKGNYDNFELSAEVRLDTLMATAVLYRLKPSISAPTHAQRGLFMHLSSLAEPNPLHRNGAIRDILAPDTDPGPLKLHEWNLIRIQVVGDRVDHEINGQKVLSADLSGDIWRKRLADAGLDARLGSESSHSFVGLGWQEGAAFRSIKIRHLPAPTTAPEARTGN